MGLFSSKNETDNQNYKDGYDEGRGYEDPLTYVANSFLVGDESSYGKGFHQGRTDKDTYGSKD